MLLPALLAAIALVPSHTVATAHHGAYSVKIVAYRGPEKTGPSATVKIFESKADKQLGTLTVGQSNGFFWYPLTDPSSIRHLTLGADGRVSFQLRITPSLGWSDTFRFHVAYGKLVRG